jgi:hypothetical protein
MTQLELAIYKKNRIAEIQTILNNNVTRLNLELAKHILKIKQTSLLSLSVKTRQINVLTNLYNINILNINNEFKKNVMFINNFVPKNINITGNKNALLIGINYTGTVNQLYGCINDTISVNSRLQQNGFKNVTILTDLTQIKATRNNILSEFTNLLKKSQPNDLLFLLYSGHGSYILDKNGDENTRYDQIIVPCDLNRIIDDELKQIIQDNLPENVTLFAMFDCCFSGSVLDLKYTYMDSLNYDKYTENSKQLETKGNVFMISGCNDYQTSIDTVINNKATGAMTWTLLESIKRNPTCTWRELVKNMRDLLKKNGYKTQTPQFSCGRFQDFDKQIFI